MNINSLLLVVFST